MTFSLIQHLIFKILHTFTKGEKLHYDPFDGDEQIIIFGKCNDSDTALPSTFPSHTTNDPPYNQLIKAPSQSPSDLFHTLSNDPSVISYTPSSIQSSQESDKPSIKSSSLPSSIPTYIPSNIPTLIHSLNPSTSPSNVPSRSPSNGPSDEPSKKPSTEPSLDPSLKSSSSPSNYPSNGPRSQTSDEPSATESPSSTPSNLGPTSHDLKCNNNEEILRIEFKTDYGSTRENTIDIRYKKKWGFKKFKSIADFPAGMLLTYSICLKKNKCNRFKLINRKGFRKSSWLRLFWEGKSFFS